MVSDADLTHLVVGILETGRPLSRETDDGGPVAVAEGRLQLDIDRVLEGRRAIAIGRHGGDVCGVARVSGQ